jgi:hypothetical protein
MRADLVVIGSVIFQNATQLRLVEHDQMIESFAPNRSDEPLDEAVLPRRARCGRVIPDPHCTNAAYISRTESAVAIAKQMTRRFVPRKSVGHLTSYPLGSRIGSDADCDQSPAGVAQNDQAVEQLERDRADYEQIQLSDAVNVIAQESLPTLGRWTAAPSHISADG